MPIKRSVRSVQIQVAMLCAILASSICTSAVTQGADKLTIGSKAPSLDIEHWVQDGEGKFPKVTKFSPGKVYVVEFWATWCGPCVASMPHIAELQTKLADKGVQIISVSNEPLDEVTQFLEKETRDEDVPTYNDLTKGYCLTCDPDGSVNEDYMEAAKQNGIPCAFVVGKDSKIEWIGHPMEIDAVLDAVVDGSWDREKFGKEFIEKQQDEEMLEKLGVKVSGLVRKKKYAEAVASIDEAIASIKSWSTKYGVSKQKLEIQLMGAASGEELEKTFESLFEIGQPEPLAINDAGWTAYEKFSEGTIKSKKVLSTAIVAVEKAIKQVKDEAMLPSFLDTLAHLQFSNGDIDGALATQTSAVEKSGEDDKDNLQEFLDEIKKAAEKKSSPKSSPKGSKK